MTLSTKDRCSGKTRATILATVIRPEVSPMLNDASIPKPVIPSHLELNISAGLRGSGATYNVDPPEPIFRNKTSRPGQEQLGHSPPCTKQGASPLLRPIVYQSRRFLALQVGSDLSIGLATDERNTHSRIGDRILVVCEPARDGIRCFVLNIDLTSLGIYAPSPDYAFRLFFDFPHNLRQQARWCNPHFCIQGSWL